MNDITEKYYNYLEKYYINNFDYLKLKLTYFPYYCSITNIDSSEYYQFNFTTKSIYFNEYQKDEIENLFNNFVVNKNNIKEFYYFGNYNYLLNDTNYLNNIKDYKIFLLFDSIKFYLFYSKKWYITTSDYSNLKSIEEKKDFENYTLYELFEKYSKFYDLNLNKLDKNKNYIFELCTTETNLIVNENFNTFFKLNNIICKITNKELNITLDIIKNISNKIGYNNRIHFNKKKDLIDTLNKYNLHYLLLKSEKKNIIINFKTFDKKKNYIVDFSNNPIKTIIDLKLNNNLNNFKLIFLSLNFYINRINILIDNKLDYYFKLYKRDKILKEQNIIYKQYDKEVIYKIHGEYLRYNYPINKNDILRVLQKMDYKKLIKILYL